MMRNATQCTSTIGYYFAFTGNNGFWGRRSEPSANALSNFAGATPKMISHQDGANMIFVDGHVKWYHSQSGLFVLDGGSYNNDKAWYTGTTNQPGPPSANMDYDADGILGTATAYE